MSVKLAVGFPFSGRYVAPEWALSIADMYYPRNLNRVNIILKGVQRDTARNTLVEHALKNDAEYLLFIDDDTAPPPATAGLLLQELETDPEAMVCGGIYTNKKPNPEPLVFEGQGSGPYWKWKFGEVFPCWGIATGCMMIRTSVFGKISEPWFRDIDSVEEAGDLAAVGAEGADEFKMTDDLYFCKKVQDAGLKILAHGGVLPVHWDQRGRGHVLPDNSYPVRDCKPGDLWYKRHLRSA